MEKAIMMNAGRIALSLALMAAAAHADDKEDLSKAIGKTLELQSYAFKGEYDLQSPLGNAPQQIPQTEGKFEKEVGLYMKAGDRGELFKKGEKLFVKQAQGEWQDSSQLQGQGGGNQGNRRALFGRMMLRNLKPPHEELKELQTAFKEVKKEKGEKVGERECTLYSGDLTDEAVKGSPLGQMLGRFGGANPEIKAVAKVWIDGQCSIAKYEIATRAAIEFQGNAVEFTLTRRNEITDAGAAKVEVPEGVKKLLDVKTEEKKE